MRFPPSRRLLLLLLAILLIGVCARVFFPTVSPLTPWIREGSRLGQVREVLRVYLHENDGHMPLSMAELKKWAAAHADFKHANSGSFWKFTDPGSGAILDWCLSPDDKAEYKLYAPIPRVTNSDGNALVTRLVMKEQPRWTFVDEREFLESLRHVSR